MMTRGRGGVWLSPENDDVIYEQPLTWSQKLVCVWPAQILPPFSKAKTGKYLKLSHDI